MLLKKQWKFFGKCTDNDIEILHLGIGLSGSRHCGKDLCSPLVYSGASETGNVKLEREEAIRCIYESLWAIGGCYCWGTWMRDTTDHASELSQKLNLSTYLFIGERLPLIRGVTRSSHLSPSSPWGQNTQPSGIPNGCIPNGGCFS